ncbi:tight adherence pilus pseudopilin TadF [Enterovibrio norvegicus]|uniref:Pilus assembly protein TadF n=1 Tax=Enterovibrio norvegicus TaxID=188144 RepID=A0A2N7L820_9GAMM|nr:tight adherence pilus pseudopilin TadF [Enterovibrio norvegicus]PMN71899.1 pilus assembly protein TadF [Enterovibrio norvegicus]PMN90269.1 pilus assembly protein TadF [Enterovibrio norvegicus]
MNSANNRKKQMGVFTIELAMILLAFSLIIVFSMDVVVKQTVKGKLDRLSYSLVSLLRERSQLFDGDESMTHDEATKSLALIERSLSSTMNTFDIQRLGMVIEQQRFDSNNNPIPPVANVHIFTLGSYSCEPEEPLVTKIDLSPLSQFDNKLTLYQVSLCYRTDNWFGNLAGESFERVRSISLSFGR